MHRIGSGQPTATAYPGRRCVCTHQMAAISCVKLRHGHRHLESMTSYLWKLDSVKNSVNRRRTILPNFIPIRFETTEPWVFLKRSPQQEEQQQQGSQQQEVKFQDQIFRKFQDNFRTLLSVSRGSRHRKCTFFCAHKCQSLKQISIAVLKMLLRQCYT